MRDAKAIIAEIRDIIETSSSYYSSEPLCTENGDTLFYMNGNDRTEFDWEANNRLCEFMTFYKATEMGCVKALVTKADKLIVYMYKLDYKFGDAPTEAVKKLHKGDAKTLYKYMLENADGRCLFDKPVNMICE